MIILPSRVSPSNLQDILRVEETYVQGILRVKETRIGHNSMSKKLKAAGISGRQRPEAVSSGLWTPRCGSKYYGGDEVSYSFASLRALQTARKLLR